jgi:hypothetical protein
MWVKFALIVRRTARYRLKAESTTEGAGRATLFAAECGPPHGRAKINEKFLVPFQVGHRFSSMNGHVPA